jgi:hypothetical protein
MTSVATRRESGILFTNLVQSYALHSIKNKDEDVKIYCQASKIGILKIEALWFVDLAEGNRKFLRRSFYPTKRIHGVTT